MLLRYRKDKLLGIAEVSEFYKGGGGSQGEVKYPSWMQDYMEALMDHALVAVDTALTFYGPDLVTAGDFAASTGWGFGANWTYDGVNDEADFTLGGGVGYLTQDPPYILLELAKEYLVTYTIKNFPVPGTQKIRIALGTANGTWRTAEGTYMELITCAGSLTLSVQPFDNTVSFSVDDIKVQAIGSTPYDGFTLFDPTSTITDMHTRQSEYKTLVDTTFDPETLWDAYYTKVQSKLADWAGNANISAAVTAFEQRQLSTHMRAVSRFAAGMADINAVNSSAFINGIALLEQDFERQVAGFGAGLGVQAEHNREMLVLNGISAMMQAFGHKASLVGQSVQTNTDIQRLEIISQTDYKDRQLQNDVRSATWDLDVLMMGANILAPLGGGTGPTVAGYESSKAANAISGALGGAAAIAAIPGAGWAGAIVGGLIGGIGGLLE